MDERLIQHEFGHEADRHYLDPPFDPQIYIRWKEPRFWALNLAWDISLDARLAARDWGLGEDYRRTNFYDEVGKHHQYIFDEAWSKRLKTWKEIENLAEELHILGRQKSRSRTCT